MSTLFVAFRSFLIVKFAMTVCTKYHAFANLDQNDGFIKGTIH
jgi:hypothetical protein